MTTYSRPGVFVQEVPLSQAVNGADNGTALGAFVGSLPKGPVTPTLVQSWSEFVKLFGTYNASYPTSFAAYSFFANGGRGAYVLRTLASDAASAGVVLTDRAVSAQDTLAVSAASAGVWGNSLTVEVKDGVGDRFSLLVYGSPLTVAAAANSNLLEQFNDLSMDSSDPRYVVSVVNTLSAFVRVSDLGSGTTAPGNMPMAAGLKALSGGADGSALGRSDFQNALTTFDPIRNPLIFNLPDVAFIYKTTDDAEVAAANLSLVNNILSDLMTYCEDRGDAFAVVDTPSSLSGSEALTFASDLSAAAAGGATGANTAVYYPWIVIPDVIRSVPGATRLLPPGGSVIGQYLATDASRGVFKAAAGLTNRVALGVAAERNLSNAELDALNSAAVPVNAIRTVPGTGLAIMGARTMHNVPGDRYVNVRRSLIYIKRELEDLSAFAVFENNDAYLRNRIRTAIGSFLAGYWSQGGLRGNTPEEAFYVKCDTSNNTAADILNGRINIEVGVAVEYPAEFVVITIGQITGSASVGQA